jgi:hypothetical protein
VRNTKERKPKRIKIGGKQRTERRGRITGKEREPRVRVREAIP